MHTHRVPIQRTLRLAVTRGLPPDVLEPLTNLFAKGRVEMRCRTTATGWSLELVVERECRDCMNLDAALWDVHYRPIDEWNFEPPHWCKYKDKAACAKLDLTATGAQPMLVLNGRRDFIQALIVHADNAAKLKLCIRLIQKIAGNHFLELVDGHMGTRAICDVCQHATDTSKSVECVCCDLLACEMCRGKQQPFNFHFLSSVGPTMRTSDVLKFENSYYGVLCRACMDVYAEEVEV